MKTAFWIEPKNIVGALRDIAAEIASQDGNIVYIEQFERETHTWLYIEVENIKKAEQLKRKLKSLCVVLSVSVVPTFGEIYGKRVIIIGGGAQVAEVAKGAISEADRHNIRGERISIDTMPVVGEEEIAKAVRAVARLPRAKILILAGSLMGGEISRAVKEIKKYGIKVISLNMAGSVPDVSDLVVTDSTQAGVMAVMDIAETAKFSISKIKGRKF